MSSIAFIFTLLLATEINTCMAVLLELGKPGAFNSFETPLGTGIIVSLLITFVGFSIFCGLNSFLEIRRDTIETNIAIQKNQLKKSKAYLNNLRERQIELEQEKMKCALMKHACEAIMKLDERMHQAEVNRKKDDVKRGAYNLEELAQKNELNNALANTAMLRVKVEEEQTALEESMKKAIQKRPS